MLMKLVVLLLTICVLIEAKVKSVITCEDDGDTVSLSCPKNHAVNVTYANFGRTEEYSVVCPNPAAGEQQTYDTDCRSDMMMLDTAKRACQGRRSCTVQKAFYLNPCPDTYKYIEVRYTCIKHFPDLAYCAVQNSSLCPDIVWNMPTNDSMGPLTCSYTPMMGEYTKEETGEPAVVRPAVELSPGTVACPASDLHGMYMAKVVISNSTGPIYGPDVISPHTCYTCTYYAATDYVMCSDSMFLEDMAIRGGCKIGGTCIPNHVLNPANPDLMCNRMRNQFDWTVIRFNGTEVAYDQFNNQPKEPVITMDVCDLVDAMDVPKNASRATAPEAAGGEGIDLTAPGAVFHKYPMKGTDHPFSFKFYLNFGNDSVEEDTTLLEWYPFLEIQRRPDDAILVKYTLVVIDEPRLVKKTVVIPEGGYIRFQDISMKMQAVMTRRKRTKRSRTDEWKMIGLGYGKEEGVPTFSVYKNGEMVDTKLGNLKGTYLRMLPTKIVVKNALFSCMEFHDELKEPEYFTNLNITGCQEAYAFRSEDEFQDCDEMLTRRH